MTAPFEDPSTDYPVLVSVHNGEFCLRIKELAIVVRNRDIQRAYEELRGRVLELIRWAKLANAIDELPAPKVIPIAPYRLRSVSQAE